MAKFEYKKLQVARDDKESTEDILNKLGSEGWEVISIDEHSSGGFLAWLKKAK